MLKFHSALVVLLFMFGLLHQVQADIPRVIHHEGYLTDASGTPIDGALQVDFSLYETAVSGSALHTEQHTVDVDDGYLKVAIGSSSQLPDYVFSTPLYLGIAVDGGTEMQPRVEITPVPFAQVAHRSELDSDTLRDLTCQDGEVVTSTSVGWVCSTVATSAGGTDGLSAYQVWLDAGNAGTQQEYLDSLRGSDGVDGSDGTNGSDGLSAYQIWLNAGNNGTQTDFLNSLRGTNGTNGVDGSDGTNGSDGLSAYQIWLNAGNNGTEEGFLSSLRGADGANGTSSWNDSENAVSSSVQVNVDVSDSTSLLATTHSGGAFSVIAWNRANSGQGGGVSAISETDAGAAISGYASSPTGETFGVYALHESDDGSAVFGHSRSETGSSYAGYFRTDSNEGTGLYGLASSETGYTVGVRGRSESTNGIGVRGTSHLTSSGGIGVFGSSFAGQGVMGATSQGRALSGTSFLNSGTALYLESVGGNFIDARLDNDNDGIYYQRFVVNGSGDVQASNYYYWSSRRWKDNIQPLSGAIDSVLQLQGATYDSTRSGKTEVGFIAEEVGAVIPSAVQWEENGIDAAGVDYARLTPYLVEAIKSQQEMIDALTNRIEQLENQ